MATLWKAELTEEMIAHLSDDGKRELRAELDRAVQLVCDDYQVGKEYKHEL